MLKILENSKIYKKNSFFIRNFVFKGTDQTMLAKLHKTHGAHRNYLKPKSDINTSFGLNHFAGVVFYDTRGNLVNTSYVSMHIFNNYF